MDQINRHKASTDRRKGVIGYGLLLFFFLLPALASERAMTDDQKELFEKYTDCVREYQAITDCLIFQNSFKLGARMMLEVMEK